MGFLVFGKIVVHAGGQLTRGRLEDCLDALTVVVEFVWPLGKKTNLLQRADRARKKPKQKSFEI